VSRRALMIVAYLIAVTILAVILWLAMSGLASFVALDWRSVTSTPIGRAGYGIMLVYFAIKMLGSERL